MSKQTVVKKYNSRWLMIVGLIGVLLMFSFELYMVNCMLHNKNDNKITSLVLAGIGSAMIITSGTLYTIERPEKNK